jgi:hypothetical protein
VCLFIAPLFVQSSRLTKKLELESYERFFEFIQIHLAVKDYYSISVGFTVVLSTICSLYIPSLLCCVLLILNLFMIYLWSFKSISINKSSVYFLYRTIFYLSLLTFCGTYMLQIPMFNQIFPESALTVIGAG